MSLRDTLLSRKPIKPVQIDGTTYYVKRMSGKQRDAWEFRIMEAVKKSPDNTFRMENLRAIFLACCLCDENGVALFDPSEGDLVGEIDGVLIEKLYEQGRTLNGITQADVDELRKN